MLTLLESLLPTGFEEYFEAPYIVRNYGRFLGGGDGPGSNHQETKTSWGAWVA